MKKSTEPRILEKDDLGVKYINGRAQQIHTNTNKKVKDKV